MRYTVLPAVALFLFVCVCADKTEDESPHILLQKASRYRKEGNEEKAREYIGRFYRAENGSGLALLRLGDDFMSQENPDLHNAELAYRKSRELFFYKGSKRQEAEARYKLAKIYSMKDQPHKVIDILMRAIKYYPEYGPPFCLLSINMDMNNEEGRKAGLEFCKNCVKHATGEEKKVCEDMLKKHGLSGKKHPSGAVAQQSFSVFKQPLWGRAQTSGISTGLLILLKCEELLDEKKHKVALECFKYATRYKDTMGVAHKRMGDIYFTEPLLDIDSGVSQYEQAYYPLVRSGHEQLAEEVSQKLSEIYKEHMCCISICPPLPHMVSHPSNSCLVATNHKLLNREVRKFALMAYRNCVDRSTGEKVKECWEIIKNYGRSE